jgi:putative RecB family exonuclease
MNLYLQCPLKYKFLYIDNLPKPFRPSGLAFGGAIHTALAWLHKQRMNGNNISLEKLLKIFDADWYAQKLDTDIRYKNGETETGLAVMAKEMLSLYFNQSYTKPVGAEVSFVLPLVNLSTSERLEVNLEGIIDLIEKDDTITEFKTSSQAMNSGDIEDNIQLTAYGYAYQMLYQRSPRFLKLIDFVKNKKPRIITLEPDPRKLDCQRFFFLARQILKGIKTKVFFPRTSFMCKDCEYGEPCKAWKGK